MQVQVFLGFSTTDDLPNTIYLLYYMVFGVKLGIKLLQNTSLQIYRHDVFYDRDLDGNVNLNSTMGVGLVAKF